jgi:hypothetical protein
MRAIECRTALRQDPLWQRQCIEIMFGRLKDWRRIATGYGGCATAFFGSIALAAIVTFARDNQSCTYSITTRGTGLS